MSEEYVGVLLASARKIGDEEPDHWEDPGLVEVM